MADGMDMGQEKTELEKLQQIASLVAELIAAQEAEMGGGEEKPAADGGSLQEKLMQAGGE